MEILDRLIEDEFRFAAGVPCSMLKDYICQLEHASNFTYVPAVDEITALGLVNGWALGGHRGILLTQNSAIGKVLDIVMSFNIPYQVPLFWIISMRGYPGDTIVHKGAGDVSDLWLRRLGFEVQFKWHESILDRYDQGRLIAWYEMKE